MRYHSGCCVGGLGDVGLVEEAAGEEEEDGDEDERGRRRKAT